MAYGPLLRSSMSALLRTSAHLHHKPRVSLNQHLKVVSYFSSPAVAIAEPTDGSIEGGLDLNSILALGGQLTPPQTVALLDSYIIGQPDAKKAVAVAMRNRWRRQKLPLDLKAEVVPKNILMVGPTGCGKTEIARRISKITEAPFIKVEATKFTEVGFHGKDVDQIIKDLVEVSLKLTQKKWTKKWEDQVEMLVEDRIINDLIGVNSSSEASFRALYKSGALDARKIKVEVKNTSSAAGLSMPNVPPQIAKMLQSQLGGGSTSSPSFEEKKITVKEARPIMVKQEVDKLMESVDIKQLAIEAVEETGIVFIDEIDKICHAKGKYHSSDASAEGVQRDLLPLIEGSSISTKHGDVKTDHILFIASGAFHTCKPSDLLAELQGRLPIRVQLNALTEDDMYRILTEPKTNLIRQQVELLATEDVTLQFNEEALREIARIAVAANRTVENIGARRLHALIEKIVEDISFEASNPDKKSGTVVIDKQVVGERLEGVLETNDLSRHIL